MASEDIGGGWQLDAQHKYNFHAGILQKGDGHTVYLKYKPHVSLIVILGGAVTWVRGFVKCFLRVPQLFCSFPAAQASKKNSQKMVYNKGDVIPIFSGVVT